MQGVILGKGFSDSDMDLPPDQELVPPGNTIFAELDPDNFPSRPVSSGANAGKHRDVEGSRTTSELYIGGLEDMKVESQPEVKDFMTIDWTYYAEKDREWGKRANKKGRHVTSMFRVVLNIYDALQSWLALAMVGFLSGVVAAMVGMGSDWMNDLKFGICLGRGFWITRQMCCKDSADMLECDNWTSWAVVLGAKDPAMLQLLSYLVYVVIAVAQAAYAAWLCKTFAPYASGSGIGEIKVILSGFVIKKFLGGWTLVIKSVGLVLSVGSGLSIGKEGPFIHVCCCIGNVVCRFFSKYRTNEGKKRELLSCAAAAGVAVAFGAPIGGVLFSLEEVSSYFPPRTMWRSLFCAVVAAMTLQRWNPLGSGKLVMFEVTYHHQWKLFELAPFMLIGAVGGLIGALINRYNVRFSKFRKTSALKKWPVTEVTVTALVTSLVCYTVVYLRGSSMRLLSALFSECKTSSQDVFEELCDADNGRQILVFLLLSAAIKVALTIVTFGQPAPGGVFVPALCIGALVGRAVGFSMQLLEQELGDRGVFASCLSTEHCITPGIYAIVGAASVLGGVTRMTVCLVVIMFEVTGGLEYVIPVMVGVLMSKWVGDAFGKDSIYIDLIRLKGYPHLDNKRDYAFSERASDVMSARRLVVLAMQDNTVASVEELLKVTTFQGFPVVTSPNDMLVHGYITRHALRRLLGQCRANSRVTSATRIVFGPDSGFDRAAVGGEGYIDLGPWLDQSPIQIVETTPLDRVVEMFRALGLRYLLVTRNGQLVGIVKKKDVIEHIELYRKGMQDRRDDI